MLWRLTSGQSRTRSSTEATRARDWTLLRPIWIPDVRIGLKIQQP